MTTGILYGVGVGPGDPGLITRRAASLIENAKVVAYPALAGEPSFARSIAEDLIPTDAAEVVIDIPMTQAREPAQKAYDHSATAIAAHLNAGTDVVALCEGDPLFYGSFMYLLARLRDKYDVQVVPGVTSLSACAARARLPLAARNGRVTVLAGPLPDAELAQRIDDADTVAIMKVGRHLPRIRKIVAQLGLTDRAIYVAQATLPHERICPLPDAPVAAPYFSMILIAKDADPWL